MIRLHGKTFTLSALSLTILFAGNGVARAQDVRTDSMGYVGGLLGISSVSDNVGTGIGYGVHAAYFFQEFWGVGAFIRGGNHNNGISSFFFGGEALYRFAEVVKGMQVGAIVGGGKFTAGGFTGNTAIAFGGKISYDYPLSRDQPITAGIDFSLVFTKPGDQTLTVWTPLVSLKWWL